MESPPASNEDASSPSARPSLAVASAIVAAGFLGSRLLGVGRTTAISYSFGTGADVGAYWVAFRLPDLVFQLLAGATLGSAFIPTFARLFTNVSEESAWRLARSVLNLVLLATIVFAVLGFLLAPLLVPVMAPGLGEDTGQQSEVRAEAVELTRIMMISPVLFAVSGMFMGILNARHHFLMPAIAPMLYNIAIIVGALAFDDVHALAWAVVIGAALHLVVQLPALVSAGMRWAPVADLRDAAVREVGRLMGPRVLGLAAFQLNLLVTIFFASLISDDAISAVNYAWLIMLTPLGLFGMAISTAVFPTMAEQAATDRSQLRETLEQSLRMILFLTVPASFALIVLGEPLVALILEYGEFDRAATEITRDAVVFYALGLFAHAAIEILSRGFYSLSDTRTPVTFAIVALAVNLVLSAALFGPLEVRGLALAISISAIVEAALLFRALRERLDGIDVRAIGASLARTIGAAVLMAEVIAFYLIGLDQLGRLDTSSLVDSFVALAGSAVLGTAVYVAAARGLRSQEVDILLRRLPLPRRAFA